MGNKKPLISICIPTYNRPKYLKECIYSVLGQKGFNNDDLELIISDNSEGNESNELVHNFIATNPFRRITYNKNKRNLGMIKNWNKLLKLKAGKYLIFLSDDDKFYDENSLKELYDNLIKHNVNICSGTRKYFDENGIINNGIEDSNLLYLQNSDKYFLKFNDLLVHGNSLGFGGILFKNNIGCIFSEHAGLFCDYDFNLQYLKISPGIIIKNTCFLYRYHSNQDSKTIDKKKSLKLYKNILENNKIGFLYKSFLILKFFIGLQLQGLFLYKIVFKIKKILLSGKKS